MPTGIPIHQSQNQEQNRPPTHPGKILKQDFLDGFEVTPAELADHIDCPLFLIEGLLEGKQRVTPDLAARLAAAFGTSTEFWTNMQARVDEYEAQKRSTTVEPLPQVKEAKEAEEDDFGPSPIKPGELPEPLDIDDLEEIMERIKRASRSPDEYEWVKEDDPYTPWDVPKYDPNDYGPLGPNKQDDREDKRNTGPGRGGNYIVTCDPTMPSQDDYIGFSAYQTLGIGMGPNDKTDA